MSKVTSKLQVTIPKAIADRYRIRPGDEIEWSEAGEVIRVVPRRSGANAEVLDIADRLRLFDAATRRDRDRHRSRSPVAGDAGNRGWTREELYDRGRPR